jgi:hypothetical protein
VVKGVRRREGIGVSLSIARKEVEREQKGSCRILGRESGKDFVEGGRV